MTRVLLVPGRNPPSPQHWQNQLSRAHPEYHRLPCPGPPLDLPARVADLRQALADSPEPAVLVAHSGGCLTVAHWAAGHTGPVRGALLVAPPCLDPDWQPGPGESDADRLPDTPRGPFSFPVTVVASRTDPFAAFDQASALAQDWGARLVDAGDAGHIDTASGYGPWPAGEALLAELL